ncbi:PAS domain-containing protein [Archangium sp.]|uniref:PAS domain-containing protein n=1 Tax=Archangium sp. TaxID=1872627 RepID=UPI00389A36D6
MPSIAELIAQHREALLQRYLEEVRRLPSARDVRPQDVLDNFPEFLDALLALSRGQPGDPGHLKRRLEETHIGLRLRLGYTLEDVTAEFVLLGRLLSRLWESLPPAEQPTPEDIQRLFDELQAAMEHAVSVFTGYSLEDRQREKHALRRMDALAADLLQPTEPPVLLDERLGALLAVLQEALRTDAATVLLVEPEGQWLRPTASCGLWATPPDRAPVPLLPPSFVAEVASSTEVLHLPEATTTPLALGEGVRSSGVHSLLGLRLWTRGQLLGVVYLGTTDARPFEPRARRLLATLVEHLAGLIDRVHLLQQARDARLLASEALRPLSPGVAARLSEERLLLAVEATGLGSWDMEPTTGALHWDERCKALFGLPPEAPVDYATFLTLVHPGDRERVRGLVRRALEPSGSGTFRDEYRVLRARDGSEAWVAATGRAFFDAKGRALRLIGSVLDITERVRERAATEREKNRATAILENISEAFEAFDRDWRFTYVNREAERILGQPREALLGRGQWELFPATVGTRLEREFRRVATERIPLSFEDYDPRSERWFDIHAYPTEEGIAVYFRDISERKCREAERERLLLEQTRLRELAEKAVREQQRTLEVLEHGEAFFLLDKDFRFVLVNENQERLSRTRREDTLGRVFWEVFPTTATPDSPYWREYHRVVEQKVPVQFEAYFAPLELWAGVSAFPTTEGGLAVFFRDITEHKLAEQFRERLVGIVSHDLRSPLQSISLATELLLRRDDVPESLLGGVRRIARSAERMARMITDLLDFTRARMGGGIPVQRRPGELAELVRATLEEFEVTHPGRVVFSSGRGPYTGQWDFDRLAQVVSNLVGNALKHGDPHAPVEVRLDREGTQLVLSVKNQGPPIPEELLPHIFDPFRRAEDSSRQGLGLGLYIVEQIVLAHGGSISVSSTEAEGTTFTVRFF